MARDICDGFIEIIKLVDKGSDICDDFYTMYAMSHLSVKFIEVL